MAILITFAIVGLFIGLIVVNTRGEKRPSISEQKMRAIKAYRASQRERGITPKNTNSNDYQLDVVESMWNF